MTIFETDDYKWYLKFKAEEVRGNLTLIAKNIQCQPSYLQRIIYEEAHLTMDQGFRLCEFWLFNAIEKKYFLTMLAYHRASDPLYKKELRIELVELQNENNDLRHVVKSEETSQAQLLLEYHADFRTALIHFLTICDKKQTVADISNRTNFNSDFISQTIKFLEEKDLVTCKGATVKFKNGFGHIPNGSPILPIFLNNWRQSAVQKSLLRNKQSVHYSNLQSIKLDDLQKLIEISKAFIRKTKMVCDESGSEDIVCINLDVFVP